MGGKGGKGECSPFVEFVSWEISQAQAHYVSELVTLVKSPGSRIEMPVAVNLLLSSKCTVT